MSDAAVEPLREHDTAMKTQGDRMRSPTRSPEKFRTELHARLRVRRPEIEQALLTRVYAVAGSNGYDPTYAEGLRFAVSSTVDYYLSVIELGEERSPSPPPLLLAQARMAARAGIGLDTVLRRCVAGRLVLGDFLSQEVEKIGLSGIVMKQLMRHQRLQASVFDRVLAAVSEEYMREAKKRNVSSEQRRADRIKRLLEGKVLDTSQFAYDFEGHHIGVLASGPGAGKAIRDLGAALNRLLLSVTPTEGTVWAWLGGRRPADPAELAQVVSASWPAQLALAIGEPGEGLSGWGLTHRQAQMTLPIALRSPGQLVRYADVALLASMLQDDLLATSLRQLYLEPLERERDGGRMSLETLRAYFSAGRNVSSAAAALGVNRNTVASRLRAIEEMIGRPLTACGPEFEAALRLAELGEPAVSPRDPALR